MSTQHGSGHPSTSTYPYASNVGNTMASGFSVTPGQALNDSLAQSRPQYQPGYLLSLAQSQATPVSGQRHEEALLIPTRAKMSTAYPRNAPSDFGSDSMFETSSKHRHREAASDEDGPPTSSVIDLMSEIHVDPRRQRLNNPRRSVTLPQNSNRPNSPPASSYQTLYVVVFGYPPSRYSSTVAHFQSIAEGGATEPDKHGDVENAFKIGYKQPWEAARAWRWNGETISGEGGRWMIGVKWMDPVVAEQVLGSVARVSSISFPGTGAETPLASTRDYMDVVYDPARSQLQQVDASQQESAPTVGTPIRLAPSASAFRKAMPDHNATDSPLQMHEGASSSPAKAKGIIGQVSDLIFGW